MLVAEIFAHLIHPHRTVIEFCEREREHHHDGQQRVEVIRNGADEQLQTVCALDKAGDGCRPRGDRGDDAHGRCRGVDKVGELGTGDAVLVRDRTHDRADGQAVEIVVDEDEHAEGNGSELRADLGLDVLDRPSAERRRAARAVHHHDHRAEHHEEDQNADVAGAGERRADHAVGKDVLECADEVKVGIQQTADEDADEQRRVDLLGQQRQRDGNDGRHERPEGAVDVAGGFNRTRAAAGGADVLLLRAGVVIGDGHNARALALGAVLQAGDTAGADGGVDHQREHERDHDRRDERAVPLFLFHAFSLPLQIKNRVMTAA